MQRIAGQPRDAHTSDVDLEQVRRVAAALAGLTSLQRQALLPSAT
jgi:hypothetical protein